MNQPARKPAGRKRLYAGAALLVTGLLLSGVVVFSALYEAYWIVTSIPSATPRAEDDGAQWAMGISQGAFFLHRGKGTIWSEGWNYGETDKPFGWWVPHLSADDHGVNWGVVAYGHVLHKDGTVHNRIGRVMVWPLALGAFVAGTLVIRADLAARRRARTGLCRHCGYSLSGLPPDSACPECGSPATR